MNINDIEAFLSIVKHRSISKASENLYLTQSSVSQRLKNLEKEVGSQLIIRSRGKRSISLTQKGNEFVPLAKQFIALTEDFNHWQDASPIKQLAIGCVDSLNTQLFPDFYKKLSDSEHQFSLQIRSHWSYVIYQLLESYKIDVGFVLEQIESSNILSEKVFSERMVIIQSAGYNNLASLVNPKILNPAKEVFLPWGTEYQIWHDSWFNPMIKPYIRVDTATLIISFVSNSDFWSIVPISMARAFEKDHDIKIFEIKDPPPDRVCYQITHRHPRPSQIKNIEIFNSLLDEFKTDSEFLNLIN